MEPKFIKVPIEVMDTVIKVLDFFAGFFGNMTDAAEFGKIADIMPRSRCWSWTRRRRANRRTHKLEHGQDTLRDFFKKVSVEGLAGQELGDQDVFK